ncbi:hypothetical protein [Xenorhabdus sp. KK7.4]|uniref:hypothetical protein n=1 Tax=Xenorhabdus sp. KK7.4 TaxID=1851572 RepID=UPI000C0430CF|nr:hypothetical protein [Xenorhabdus sp. KK7.4]PHM54536.1 hypothetical protein Xekk_02522 [Xenorhabdus sp. KK7.4]
MNDFVDDIFDDDFFRQEITLIPNVVRYNPYGEAVDTDGKSRLVIAIVQPAGSDDLQMLPEGDRYNPTIRVMTQEEVKPKDKVIWQGHTWRITNNSRWNDYGYYDSLATRYEGSQKNSGGGFEIT